jgi:hypothetical protein
MGQTWGRGPGGTSGPRFVLVVIVVVIEAIVPPRILLRPSVPFRRPVDSELLMAEWHRLSDYDNDNDCIRCSTKSYRPAQGPRSGPYRIPGNRS